ncbi:MAG: hypothetical protein HYU29_08990 [Chloroflexi bacterium]|nr:hypothetical protein [Chloroflexota bacterium]
MAKGISVARQWQTRTDAVDFIRNEGGYYAVLLRLDTKYADKLAKDLRQCVTNAKKLQRDRIELIAHWGRRSAEGFLLRTRVAP